MRASQFRNLAGFVFSAIVGVSTLMAADGVPVLYGVIGKDGNKLAWLGLELNTSRWHNEGEVVDGFKLVEINVDGGHAILAGPNGGSIKIHLSGMGGEPAPHPTLIAAEDLDWDWIRSDANPMRKRPIGTPAWVAKLWMEAEDESERIPIKNYYRRMGWDPIYMHVYDYGTPQERIRQTIERVVNPSDPVLTKEELNAVRRPITPNSPNIRTPIKQ